MPATRAATVQQRQDMARLADQGKSYQSVAARPASRSGQSASGFAKPGEVGWLPW